MEKKRFITIWVIVEVICALTFAYSLYLRQNKTDIIIYFGIKTANIMIDLLYAIALAALLITFFLFFDRYQKLYRRKKTKKPKPGPAPAKIDINSEAYIRGKLEHFLGLRPQLRDELTECLKQMDSINEKQASLHEVRSRSSGGFLQSIADSLDKAESSIWKNLLGIINIAEIWVPDEAGDPGWSAVYNDRRKAVKAGIKLNDDLLKQSAILLTKGTTFANDRSLSNEAKDDLEATIKVIDQLRDMSGIPAEETE